MAKYDPKKAGRKGGRERARRLTDEQRQEIARKAAEARWAKQGRAPLPQATHEGALEIGDIGFWVANLNDEAETRVMAEKPFMKALGMYRSGALSTRRRIDEESGARVPLYLAFKNLKPFVEKHFSDVHMEPLKYRTVSGQVAHGIRADLLPKICNMWLDARDAGVLGARQQEIAKKADILVRAFADVGIIALVDEATGYQDTRARDALAVILNKFIAKELRRWVKTFPEDFYKEIFRLRGWAWREDSNARPQVLGHITNDLIYARLAPGVLEELRRLTPRDEKSRAKHRFHQRLTEDLGHPALREHLGRVTMLAAVSKDWDEFMYQMDKRIPAWNTTGMLDFKD